MASTVRQRLLVIPSRLSVNENNCLDLFLAVCFHTLFIMVVTKGRHLIVLFKLTLYL